MGVLKKWTVLSALGCGLVAGLLAGAFFGIVHDLPQINRLKQFKPAAVTTVYSRDNRVITRFYIQQRYPVSIDQVPLYLIQALITTEDRDFYEHAGIHLKGILRAIIQDIRAGSFKQGASTLTQQLAKTLFLSPEKSIVRKIREAILSVQIERRYTKNEILELYLNLIYMGSGAYGVEAAARTYFDTSVSRLTLGQAALIAGLPKAPSIYSPLNRPDLARKRRRIVLQQMLKTGLIDQIHYNGAVAEPIAVEKQTAADARAPYFVAHLRNELKSVLDEEMLYSQGLAIHTTLDMDLQQQAETAVRRHMLLIEKRMSEKSLDAATLQTALVAIDVGTGAIRGLIGGRAFETSQFNRAVQARRQPGSAFKPFVYAAALAKGWSQQDTLVDAPLSVRLGNGKTWQVQNYSPTFGGPMTLRKALALSKNTPVVRLLQEIGPEPVIELARKTGIATRLDPIPSLALGTCEVTLLELTAAYIPFANRGTRVLPFAIDRITDKNGSIIYKTLVRKESIMDPRDAAVTTDMLSAVIREGTGKKADDIKTDIAGKTGTTDDYRDALFIGYSPDLSLGVWVGNDDGSPLGRHENGARAALPIWHEVMAAHLKGQAFHYFDIPDGTKRVYIDADTGESVPARAPNAVRALIRDNT